MADEQTGGGVVAYLDETRSEMQKVVWPTREEAWNLTVVVLFVVVLVMFIIFGIDFVLSRVMRFLFDLRGL